MVTKSLVEAVHSRIVSLLDEAKRHSDGPRVVAIIEILEQLTNLNPSMPAPPCDHKRVEQGICQDCGGEIPSLMLTPPAERVPPNECAHTDISPFGVCRICHTCLHQFRSGDGTCHQCGDQVELEPTQQAADASQ
jgi:hypothetical protein